MGREEGEKEGKWGEKEREEGRVSDGGLDC